MVYLDDILIFSDTLEDYKAYLITNNQSTYPIAEIKTFHGVRTLLWVYYYLAQKKARDNQKKYYNRNHLLVSFDVGDWVLLNRKNLKIVRPTKKLDHKYLGLFQVLEKWGSQAYKLKLTPAYNKIHPVFHVSLLKKYKQREGKTPPPGPELVDSEEEWLIDEILEKKVNKNGKVLGYRVH
ncbi:hypothetical protein TEQG_08625 [Trichophyton equinum CBS 127.97]|uniref:Tf2-1-like SH3-like domain-containing protein n=1 Tax=Trichophyton equinum (strain ATCC MYA-4606 / CBS 127.97) TaxID=559882 RepID=F2PMY5_TRIEC|nr:hypothetical protein TEQG_08625 [Trichophyton equinum CBS 127.97]